MAEQLIIEEGNKNLQYKTLLPQIESLITGETDAVANMANITAALKQTFGFFWIGFYVVKEHIGAGSFSGSYSLHTYKIWKRSLWYSLERVPHCDCSGC